MDPPDVRRYLQEVARIPRLDECQTLMLAQELFDGRHRERARDRLVEAHLPLAVSVAKKYMGRGLSIGALIEESNIGLLRAVDRYDYYQGVRFVKYSIWWMRRAIVDALEAQQRDQHDRAGT